MMMPGRLCLVSSCLVAMRICGPWTNTNDGVEKRDPCTRPLTDMPKKWPRGHPRHWSCTIHPTCSAKSGGWPGDTNVAERQQSLHSWLMEVGTDPSDFSDIS